MSLRHGSAILAAILVGLVFIAYHAAPDNGFHFDDYANIVEQKPLHVEEASPSALVDAALNGRLPRRFVANLTLAFDWWRVAAAVSVDQSDHPRAGCPARVRFTEDGTRDARTRWGSDRCHLGFFRRRMVGPASHPGAGGDLHRPADDLPGRGFRDCGRAGVCAWSNESCPALAMDDNGGGLRADGDLHQGERLGIAAGFSFGRIRCRPHLGQPYS